MIVHFQKDYATKNKLAGKPRMPHYTDFRRTSKSFAALPCNRPIAAKHMLFCLPEPCRQDNFIMTIHARLSRF
jgi:hypothetical protein